MELIETEEYTCAQCRHAIKLGVLSKVTLYICDNQDNLNHYDHVIPEWHKATEECK